MRAIFNDRLQPKLAYEFVQVVCTTWRNRFFEILNFTIFSTILNFEKVAFISVYAPKCLCGLYLSADCDQS